MTSGPNETQRDASGVRRSVGHGACWTGCMRTRGWSVLGAMVASLLVACAGSGGEASDDTTEGALAGPTQPIGSLVPETAPTEAVVLANADLFAGVNELHYTFLRGLFGDAALNDVKVFYLSPDDQSDVVTPVRSVDGDRLMGKFSTRFAKEIKAGRLVRTRAAVETNWARDYFPMTLATAAGGARKAARFAYENTPATGPAAEAAATTLGLSVTSSPLTLEGGNIMVDEDGVLYSSTKILTRNKTKSKADVEAELTRMLGVKAIEWMTPLPGESTQHVDIVAKVMGKKRVIVGDNDGVCPADAPPTCKQRKAALDANAAIFARRGYKVTRIMNAESGGDFRALTYANSLLVNGTAFLPMYFDPSVADDLVQTFQSPQLDAKAIVKDCATKNPFPGTTDLAADLVARERARCSIDGVVKAAKGKSDMPTEYYAYAVQTAERDTAAKKAYESLGFRVVQVPGAAMINFGGSVHCVSMQIPKR